MRTGAAFADILYLIFSVLFYLLLIAFGFILALEVFTDDGQIGKFSSNFHSSRGYSIPVEFIIEPEAPMLDNIKVSDYKEEIDEKGQKTYTYYPQYANTITSIDSLNFRTIVSAYNPKYEIKSTVFRGDGYIYVKPKTGFKKIIILLKTYLNLVLWIITFFLLKNIFKCLRINIEFSQKLYKLIQLLGIVLILSVLLSVISNFILGNALSDISINPLNYDLRYIKISMDTHLDINFTLIIIGLSLIILSSLLKMGIKMQQENNLTI